MIIYNSGCSFTSPMPGILKDSDMYWYMLGKDLNATKFINDSQPGSSNNLIIQRVYNHVLANLNLDCFYVINLTSLNRIQLCQNQTEKLQEILIPAALATYDFETMELTAYVQIMGLVSFLQLHKKNFYIINNSKEFTNGPWPPRDNFMKFVSNTPRILNLYQYSKFDFHSKYSRIKPIDYNLYGWNGHDGPDGHLAYYKKLKEIIIDRMHAFDPVC